MNFVNKTFIHITLATGKKLNDELVREVKERDFSKIEFPKEATSFHFFDQGFAIKEVDGKKVSVATQLHSKSEVKYIGTFQTLDQVRKEDGADSKLYSNILYMGGVGAAKTAGKKHAVAKKTDVIPPSKINYEK